MYVDIVYSTIHAVSNGRAIAICSRRGTCICVSCVYLLVWVLHLPPEDVYEIIIILRHVHLYVQHALEQGNGVSEIRFFSTQNDFNINHEKPGYIASDIYIFYTIA